MTEKTEKKQRDTSSGLDVFEAFMANSGLGKLIDSLKPEPQITLQEGAHQFPGMKRIERTKEVTVVRR